jgi:hypothetical protein
MFLVTCRIALCATVAKMAFLSSEKPAAVLLDNPYAITIRAGE